MNVFRDHAPGLLSAATRHPAETAGPGDAQVAPEPADLLVIGLGYVGLPLAREAAFAGLTVVGYDLNTEVVAGLNAGRSHVGDVPAGDIAEMLRKGFRATASEEEFIGVRELFPSLGAQLNLLQDQCCSFRTELGTQRSDRRREETVMRRRFGEGFSRRLAALAAVLTCGAALAAAPPAQAETKSYAVNMLPRPALV